MGNETGNKEAVMQVEVCLTGKCGQCYRCWCMELVRKNRELKRRVRDCCAEREPLADSLDRIGRRTVDLVNVLFDLATEIRGAASMMAAGTRIARQDKEEIRR